LCEAFTQRVRVHEVREGPLPVDLHNGQPLAVARLELGIAGDVDLLEGESLLSPNGL
jgi:hypothetical protein